MRANEGTSRRVTAWRKLAALAAGTALALSVIGAGTASAATPGWSMNVTELPAKVTAGENAGYRVQIFNTGKSNISQVFLTQALITSDGLTHAFPGDTILDTTFVSSTQGTCDAAGTRLYCALGAIRANRSATVVVAFSTAGYDHLVQIFEANTTGVAGDQNNASHGDVLQGVGTTATGTGGNFAGKFITDTTTAVNDEIGLTADNEQSTKVNVPAGARGVSVADGTDAAPVDCAAAGFTCFSETSEIHVDAGASFGSGFSVEIGIYKDLAQTVQRVIHQFDDGTFEVLSKCPKRGTPSNCFNSANAGGGSILVTVYLTKNGGLRM